MLPLACAADVTERSPRRRRTNLVCPAVKEQISSVPLRFPESERDIATTAAVRLAAPPGTSARQMCLLRRYDLEQRQTPG